MIHPIALTRSQGTPYILSRSGKLNDGHRKHLDIIRIVQRRKEVIQTGYEINDADSSDGRAHKRQHNQKKPLYKISAIDSRSFFKRYRDL